MAYKMVMAIRSGVLPDRPASLEPGPVNHSRWLTTANRFLRLWASQRGFKGKKARNLALLCGYIVGVFYSMWFRYEIRNNWLEGPQIYSEHLQVTILQPEKVVSSVYPRLESSARSWWVYSEMLLQTPQCSAHEGDRTFAVQDVMEVRALEAGRSPVRTSHKSP